MPEQFYGPDRARWHQLRAKHVGASESAVLFGVQPAYAMSPWTLWQAKSGRMAAPEVSGERPAWGLRLEEAIGAAVAEQEGWRLRRAGYWTHDAITGMGCSPDFVILGSTGQDSVVAGLLDTKNVDWLIHRRQWGDEPPLHIIIQLQHQLACTGFTWGAIGALVGGNHLEVYRYERQPRVVAEIERRVAKFWTSIAAGREPPIDGSESTARAVAAIYAEAPDGELADLSGDNELPELCGRYLAAAARRREAKAEERQAHSAIIAKLGAHRRGSCEGFSISATPVPAMPDRVITEDMVGQTIKGRAGYRRLAVKEAQ